MEGGGGRDGRTEGERKREREGAPYSSCVCHDQD